MFLVLLKLEHVTGVGREDIQDWVQRADLMRVPGVGTEYSKLLKRAGVVTVRDLRRRNPDRLHEKVTRVNREQGLVVRLPGRSVIDSWVRCAGELPGDPYPPPRKASG